MKTRNIGSLKMAVAMKGKRFLVRYSHDTRGKAKKDDV